MIFGGIDPGFGRCGVATTKDGMARSYSTIETNDDQCFADRLVYIESALNCFLGDYKPGEIIIGIEMPMFISRNTNAGKVHQVIGVILATLAKNGHSYIEHSPSHVKASISGGRATKSQIKKAVGNILDIQSFKGIKDDAIDALAICICTQLDYLKKT